MSEEKKAFSTLNGEEQQKLIKQLGECLMANDLGFIKVELITETVCNINDKSVEHNVKLSIEKDLPSADEEIAKKFTEEANEITKGYTDIKVNVVSKLSAGDSYSTITKLMPIQADAAMSLEHKKGEVWLVDFWATWCPPCQGPMAHNVSMLDKRGNDWEGKIRIIGIRID